MCSPGLNAAKIKLRFSPRPQLSFSTATNHSWNDTIKQRYALGAHKQVLIAYSAMLSTGIAADSSTFPCLLNACSSPRFLIYGLAVHCHLIVKGYVSDVYLGASLVHMYAKGGDIRAAQQVFDRMPERSVVPWTTIISGYLHEGDIARAFDLYRQMRHQGTEPNAVTVLSLLSTTSHFTRIICLHGHIIRSGFERDLPVANSLLNVYAKCGRLEVACQLFEKMRERDVISWNSIVLGHSLNGDVKASVDMLTRMRLGGTKPNLQTFGSVVSAIANLGMLEPAKALHAQILTSGFESDVVVETALVGMYSKCGNVTDALELFERIVDRDAVSWTTAISGLVLNDRADIALSVFRTMLQSKVATSTETIASALAACAQLCSLDQGTSIHAYIIRHKINVDIAARNSLVTMYAKCGRLKQCHYVFDMILDRDVVSWNAIVAGYAQNGHLDEAFSLFSRMKMADQRPDSITIVALLQACASLGALHQGKLVHTFIIRNELRSCISIDTALIDMYSKCGVLETAQRCFDGMPEHDVVSWSAIMAGYGNHGKGTVVLEMYSDLLQAGIRPTHVTFLSVLSACSHAGLVKQGLNVFRSMVQVYKIEPKLEHCACVVDLLGRAGRVDQAYWFIKRMLPQPNADVLGIVLSSCRIHGKEELGQVVANEILRLNPENAVDYVQLANSYAAMSRWDGVGEVRMRMRSLGLKKEPGWSFIQLHGIITVFFVDQTSHARSEDIISVLKVLDIATREDLEP